LTLQERSCNVVFMSAAKTSSQRVAEMRARRKAGGLTVLELYAHPADHAAIRAYVARLQRKREKEKPPPA
jgi:ribosomal protein L15E